MAWYFAQVDQPLSGGPLDYLITRSLVHTVDVVVRLEYHRGDHVQPESALELGHQPLGDVRHTLGHGLMVPRAIAATGQAAARSVLYDPVR